MTSSDSAIQPGHSHQKQVKTFTVCVDSWTPNLTKTQFVEKFEQDAKVILLYTSDELESGRFRYYPSPTDKTIISTPADVEQYG